MHQRLGLATCSTPRDDAVVPQDAGVTGGDLGVQMGHGAERVGQRAWLWAAAAAASAFTSATVSRPIA